MKLSEIKKITGGMGISPTMNDQQELYAYLRAKGIEPGDLYKELEMTSRYVDTHRDTSFSNTSVLLHSHTFYEILYCCNSCNAEYLVGAERYRLRKGDIVIVPPGVSHRPILPTEMEAPYKRYVLWLSMEFVNQLMQQYPDNPVFQSVGTRMFRTEGTDWEYLGTLFRRGVEEAERGKPGWEMMVASNAIQLIVEIRRAIMEQGTQPLKAENPELLDRVLAYIEKNLDQKITLGDVAKHFWVSQSTVTQTFRNKMGVSFYRCVTQRRLIAAKNLILESIPLERVGMQVGFSDYSSFYRAFKQEYGISPRQYRKMQEGTERIPDSWDVL